MHIFLNFKNNKHIWLTCLCLFLVVTAGICFSFVGTGSVIIFNLRIPEESFALTYGFADVGNSAGIMILPIVVEYLRDIYGFRGSILLLGGVILHTAPLILLMKCAGCAADTEGRTNLGRNREETVETQHLIQPDSPAEEDLCEGDVRDKSSLHNTRKENKQKQIFVFSFWWIRNRFYGRFSFIIFHAYILS